jgi:hypothetical protein
MLTSYGHIQNCILVALAYYRQIETGAPSIGALDIHAGSKGSTSTILRDFCLARSIDFGYLATPGDSSALFRDLGQLAAEIETPGRIFENLARQTALEVVHHVLNIEGWAILARPQWEAEMKKVDPSLAIADRADAFREILTRYVTFSGDPVDAFAPAREWGKAQGLWPHR